MDAYAGKKAKLQDAALLNHAGKFVRYSKADWSFNGINITTPPSDSDGWATFNITDLPGAKTYPVATVSQIFCSQDLTERGKSSAKHTSAALMSLTIVRARCQSLSGYARVARSGIGKDPELWVTPRSCAVLQQRCTWI